MAMFSFSNVSGEDRQIFHEAIIRGNLVSIDECLQKGLIMDHSYRYWNRGNKEFTPLICAVENQNMKVVEHLLKRGANVLIKPFNGETPLSTATEKGNLKVVKLLLKNGAKPTMQTALLAAIKKRNLNIVKYFVEEGVCINWEYANGDTPLSTAIKNGCEEIAKFLIGNDTAHPEIFCDPDCTIVLFLDYHVANPTIEDALLIAMKYRRLTIVKYIIEKGVSVNWEDANGDTLLSTAINNGCEEIAKFLIDNGARIDQINNKGRTALSVAAEGSHLGCAKYLIESGADINLAQNAVDAYAKRNDDFKYFLKLFTLKQEQLKSSSSDVKETSSTADEKKCLHCRLTFEFPHKETGFGQEEAPSTEK